MPKNVCNVQYLISVFTVPVLPSVEKKERPTDVVPWDAGSFD